MRLIDADALQLAIVEEGQANKRKKYNIGDFWELTGAEIREVINSQPTIQPEQPKRGRWLKNKTTWTGYTCSVCGDVPYMQTCMGKPKYDYCPFCGADMRGEQNEIN